MSCLPVYGVAGARRRAARLVSSAAAALSGFPGRRTAPLTAIARFVLERVV
jgi:hypothetical protein